MLEQAVIGFAAVLTLLGVVALSRLGFDLFYRLRSPRRTSLRLLITLFAVPSLTVCLTLIFCASTLVLLLLALVFAASLPYQADLPISLTLIAASFGALATGAALAINRRLQIA